MFLMRKGIAMSSRLALIGFGLALLAGTAVAGEMTAFELIKEGNKHVGEDAKDKVVQIRSEKSIGGLNPNIWYIVYFDPDATFQSTEVKFGAGKKLSVRRPTRLLEPITGAHKPLPREKLKVDSDKAIAIATKEPILEKLTLKAAELKLERMGSDSDQPVWKIKLWAAKLKNPNDSADIGQIFVSAEDGKVVKTDVHPNRID